MLADGDGVLSAAAVIRLRTERKTAPDRDLLAAVDSVVDALDLRSLAAGWGHEVQRIANLDAFRAHVIRYRDERLTKSGTAPSIVGFLRYLDALVAPPGWGKRRQDTLARVGSEDAVSVSTWHAAKGLEWPIVVLFGLETVREPQAYGVHILTDRATFDVKDPLGGRWIHFWPNPYTNAIQRGPVKDAYAGSAVHAEVSRKAKREALRVLYVGWTRSRDRLVLASQKNKLLTGILGTLVDIDRDLISAPSDVADGAVATRWASHPFDLQVSAHRPVAAAPIAVPDAAGQVRVGRAPTDRPPASLVPSSAPPRSARFGRSASTGRAAFMASKG